MERGGGESGRRRHLIICSSASLSRKNGRAWNYYIQGVFYVPPLQFTAMEFSAGWTRGIPDRGEGR